MRGGNFKQFLLHHAEKIGFGVFLLLSVTVLALADWSPYEKTPQQLAEQIAKANANLDASQWPEEERQKLTDWPDITQRGRALLRGPERDAFQLDMFVPVYKRSEPILEPKFLAVMQPIADAGEALIEVAPPEEEDEEMEGDEKDKDEEEKGRGTGDLANPFKTADARDRAGAGAGAEGGGFPFGGPPGMGAGMTPDLMAGYGDAPTEPGMDMMSEMGLAGYGMMGGGTTVKERYGEGHRYVAVRGVIDWAAQKAAFIKALHLSNEQAIQYEPEIIDFHIERQRQLGDSQDWSEWEQLDISNSQQVLEKALDFEAEVVDISITDSAITEPLPRRILREWGDHATHPAVENFKLSKEEQQKEQLRQAVLVNAYGQVDPTAAGAAGAGGVKPPEPVKKGGWDQYVHNMRGIENSLGGMMGSEMMAGQYGDVMNNMQAQYGEMYGSMFGGAGGPSAGGYAGPGSASGSPQLLRKRSAASGRLMLFRYFDFDVEPGEVYRYRVRIEYRNPNYLAPAETLASPDSAEGATRLSEWSEPTPPANVLPEAEYYLTRVEPRRTGADTAASLSMFQWNPDFGTIVHEEFKREVGDQIGARGAKIRILNPLKQTFEVEPTDLTSGDFLVDIQDRNYLGITGQLADLENVPARALIDQAVVLTNRGTLKTLDPLSEDKSRRDAEKIVGFQNEIGEEWEEKAQTATDLEAFSGEGGMMGSEMMGAEYGQPGGGRISSAAKKGRRGSRRNSREF